MDRKCLRPLILFYLFFGCQINSFSQISGDFQTKNATGNWSDFNSWNRYSGSAWVAATAGQLPTSGADVYVQAGHTINVNATSPVCKDLNVNGDNNSKIAFKTATAILNVRRDINLFSNTHNCFASWTPGAKILLSNNLNQKLVNFSDNSVVVNIEVDKTAGSVSLASSTLNVSNTLILTKETLDIGAAGTLKLNGAALIATLGEITGSPTSNLVVTGTTGGTVLLPFSTASISLRNITISGTRTLQTNAAKNINLYGLLNIGASATFDNGDESQINYNAGASINISGKFINRDKDNFTGTNGAIPGNIIVTILNSGSTVEYALTGDQIITARADYSDITLSGSGIKKPSNTFTPLNSLYITGSAVLDDNGHNIGDNTTPANLTMDGNSRFILTTSTPTATRPYLPGAYNLSGNSVIEFKGNNATTQTVRPKMYQNIEISGTNVGNSNGNIILNTNGTFTVKTGATFQINDNTITGTGGSQTITVENGATFKTGNNKGFNGFTPTLTDNSSISSAITNIILNAGSTVNYTRPGDQPVTNANGLVYQHLVLSGSSNKTAPAGMLTIQGNLTRTGTPIFVHNNGSVLLNGASQNFAGLGYNNLLLQNSTKTTAGNASITDSLKVYTSTQLSLSNNDTIVLNSSQNKTARLAQLEGSINYGNSSSKFVVQRFIPGHRAWRFLTVPLISNQTINAGWQEGATTSTSNPNPGYGTHISGGTIANGFDQNTTGRSSLKTYNTTADNWEGVLNTTTVKLNDADGYMIFIRGSRANNLSLGASAPLDNTILRAAGQLKTGTVTYNYATAGVHVISNPYASSIDYRNVSSSVLNKGTFYVYDPNLNPSNAGGFQTCVFDGSRYIVTPGGGSYPSGYCDTLQSGQAFFVKVVSAGNDYVFTENCKVIDKSNAAVFSPVKKRDRLKANLYEVYGDGSASLLDGNLVLFDEHFNEEVGDEDSKKLTNNFENFAVEHDKIKLAVEQRRPVSEKDSIMYSLTQLKNKKYQFHFILSIQKRVKGFVTDNYLKTSLEFNLNGELTMPFTVNADPGSFASNRFVVKFLKAPPEKNIIKPDEKHAVQIYPNPLKGNRINVYLKAFEPGTYQIRVINVEGKLVASLLIDHASNLSPYFIVLPKGFSNQYLSVQVIHQAKVAATIQVKN